MNDRELLKYWNDIPIGAKNAATYEELSAKWHCTYRRVRKILELLSAADTGDDYILIRFIARSGLSSVQRTED